jgi:hypothetical protein
MAQAEMHKAERPPAATGSRSLILSSPTNEWEGIRVMTVRNLPAKYNSPNPVVLTGWELVAALGVIAAAGLLALVIGSTTGVMVVVTPLLLVLGVRIYRG